MTAPNPMDGSFAGPAGITGGLLLGFAVLGLRLVRREPVR
jgi:hypothetical protein